MRYTAQELDSHALGDLLSDAEQAESQAINGPFYPDRNITPESLRAYASLCRAKIALFANGGAHKGVLQS